MTDRRIAILVDGGFFLKRLPALVPAASCATPEAVVECLTKLCRWHVKLCTGDEGPRWQNHLHRILFYDARPYDGKAHHPIDNRSIDFAKSDLARFRNDLFDLLRRQRKVALRLGKVNKDSDWALSPSLTKRLLKTRALDRILAPLGEAGDIDPAAPAVTLSLSAADAAELARIRDVWRGVGGGAVALGLRQKGVDMRIGIDIATLTLKRQVETIILVAGDSDFVPAAKLARREGVEIILDPLWQQVNDDLHEHIDGLQSGLRRPAPVPEPVDPLAALAPSE